MKSKKEYTAIGKNKNITKQIVFASYNDDKQFLEKYFPNIEKIIYEKSDQENYKQKIINSKNQLKISDFINKINDNYFLLPNIGFCSHTYLYHIISNYEKLADITIFIAGDCLMEFGPKLETIKKINDLGVNKMLEDFINLSEEIGKFPPGYPNIKSSKKEWVNRFKNYYKDIFEEECPTLFTPAIDSTFAATKEAIQRRPRSFYENAIKYIDERTYSNFYWADSNKDSIMYRKDNKFKHKTKEYIDWPGCCMMEHCFQKMFDRNFNNCVKIK
jgi:hypothetical protein